MLLQSPTPAPDLHLPPSNWRNPVVIGLIGAICTIFLLLSYYKIFKRHCFSLGEAPMLRYRTERRLINESNTDEPSLQFQSRALDSSILYSLPTIQYRKKSEGEIEHGETETETETDCAVCLGEFQDGDWLRFLPNCTHSFHISCIDTWFESHSNCPLCRSNIIYSLADHHHGYSVSMLTLLETLRRDDAIREAAAAGAGGPHIVVHSESLQTSTATVRPLQPIPTQTS